MSNSYEKVGEIVSIFARGGTWYANYQHAGRQQRRSLKTQSKKEARRRALLIEKEILGGDYKHRQRAPLIKEAVEKYLNHLRAEGRTKKTVRKYEHCFDLLLDLADRRGRTRLSQLDVDLVDQFRAERAAGSDERKPSKPKTVNNDTVTIRQLVNFALQRGMISDDPLKELKIKKSKRTPQPCWTPAQVNEILSAAKSPHREPLLFLAETGARVGEAKWLTWDDVDLENRLVYIRPKPGWKPKSGDERVVPMSDRLFEMLQAMPKSAQWVLPPA